MTGFAWPWIFVLLPLPFVVRYFFFTETGENEDALKVPFFSEVAGLSNRKNSRVSKSKTVRFIWLFLIWSLLICAAARPEWAGVAQPITQKSRNMVMVIDLSDSMRQTDFEYRGETLNRFDALKIVADDFLEKRTGDRIGIVAFGLRAYEYVPLTSDLNTARNMLKELEIGFAGPLTSVGDAMGVALKGMEGLPAKDRVMILLSDGAANAGVVNIEQAIRAAKEMGVKVYTIGIGAYEQKVRGLFGTQVINPAVDLDEETLKRIAGETGGEYFRAYDLKEFEKIYDRIDELEPVISSTLFVRPRGELFYYPLGAAIFLSIIMLLVFNRGVRHLW